MRRTSFANMHCSLARTLEMIGDWWTPLVIRDLYLGLTRFDDLVTDLGVSRNLLTARMKQLVEHGIVEMRAYETRPPRYEYVLTEKGRDLVPPFMALTAWGDRWAAPKAGSPILFVHRDCGEETRPTVCCSRCSGTLSAQNVELRPGPGAKSARGTRLIGRGVRDKARSA